MWHSIIFDNTSVCRSSERDFALGEKRMAAISRWDIVYARELKNRPTAVLKSVSKCALDLFYTSLLNMKLVTSLFRRERHRYGMYNSSHDFALYHVHFNVVSPEMLQDAQKHPEKYCR